MQRIQNEKVGSDWGGDDGGGPPGGTRVIAAAVTMLLSHQRWLSSNALQSWCPPGTGCQMSPSRGLYVCAVQGV